MEQKLRLVDIATQIEEKQLTPESALALVVNAPNTADLDELYKRAEILAEHSSEQALALFDFVYRLAKRDHHDFIMARSAHAIGIDFYHRGGYREAKRWLEESLGLFETLGRLKECAAACNNLGLVYIALGEQAAAITCYQRALGYSQQTKDQLAEAQALSNLGLVYRTQGEHQAAQGAFQASLTLAEALNDTAAIAAALGNLGNLAFAQGELQQASQYQEQAIACWRQLGREAELAHGLANLGNLEYSTGQLEAAFAHYREAVTLLNRLQRPVAVAQIYCNLGTLYQISGDLAESERVLLDAMATFENAGYLQGVGQAAGRLSELAYQHGQFARAMAYRQQEMTAFQKIGFAQGVADSVNQIGNIHFTLGDLVQARNSYEQALTLDQRLGNLVGQGRALGNLGNICFSQGDYANALAFYGQARSVYSQAKATEGIIQATHNIGLIHHVLRSGEAARLAYREAFQQASSAGYQREAAEILYNLARLFRDVGQLTEASLLCEQSLHLAEKIENVNLLWRGHYLHGDIQIATGQPDDAYTSYTTSVALAEDVRALAILDEYRQLFFSNKKPIFDDLVLLATKIHRPTDAWLYAERARGRAMLDLQAAGTLASPSSAPAALINREAVLLALVQETHSSPAIKHVSDNLSWSALQAVLTELDAVWDELAQVSRPCADYVSLRRAEPISFAILLETLNGGANIPGDCQ